MKVKKLIQELQKCDSEKEVVIRFALDIEDEIGYVLETALIGEYGGNIAIYAEYTATPEDCAFMGQVDLKEAYLQALEEK